MHPESARKLPSIALISLMVFAVLAAVTVVPSGNAMYPPPGVCAANDSGSPATKPKLTSSTWLDDDNNGHLDAVILTANKGLAQGSVRPSDFSITTYTSQAIAVNATGIKWGPDNTQFTLFFPEGLDMDAGAPNFAPILAYNQDARDPITDCETAANTPCAAAGACTAFVTGTKYDSAKPVLKGAYANIGDFRFTNYGSGAGCPANCGAGTTVANGDAEITSPPAKDTTFALIRHDGSVTGAPGTCAGMTYSATSDGLVGCGDTIYADKDNSGTVTVGDFRFTKYVATAPGVVAMADPDAVAPPSIDSTVRILRVDNAPSGTDVGDTLYADMDVTNTISAGDGSITVVFSENVKNAASSAPTPSDFVLRTQAPPSGPCLAGVCTPTTDYTVTGTGNVFTISLVDTAHGGATRGAVPSGMTIAVAPACANPTPPPATVPSCVKDSANRPTAPTLDPGGVLYQPYFPFPENYADSAVVMKVAPPTVNAVYASVGDPRTIIEFSGEVAGFDGSATILSTSLTPLTGAGGAFTGKAYFNQSFAAGSDRIGVVANAPLNSADFTGAPRTKIHFNAGSIAGFCKNPCGRSAVLLHDTGAAFNQPDPVLSDFASSQFGAAMSGGSAPPAGGVPGVVNSFFAAAPYPVRFETVDGLDRVAYPPTANAPDGCLDAIRAIWNENVDPASVDKGTADNRWSIRFADATVSAASVKSYAASNTATGNGPDTTILTPHSYIMLPVGGCEDTGQLARMSYCDGQDASTTSCYGQDLATPTKHNILSGVDSTNAGDACTNPPTVPCTFSTGTPTQFNAIFRAPTLSRVVPTIKTASTLDSNHDGLIDRIVLTFSASIDDTTFEYQAWTVNVGSPQSNCAMFTALGAYSYAVSGQDTGSATNDKVMLLKLDQKALPPNVFGDTGCLPTVTYTPGAGPTHKSIKDLSNNAVVAVTNGAVLDMARPVLVNLFGTLNSTIAQAVFSENVQGSGPATGSPPSPDVSLNDFQYNNNGAGGASGLDLSGGTQRQSSPGNKVTLKLNAPLTATDRGSDCVQIKNATDAGNVYRGLLALAATPNVGYPAAAFETVSPCANGKKFADANGPTVGSITTVDSNHDGFIDAIKVQVSDTIVDGVNLLRHDGGTPNTVDAGDTVYNDVNANGVVDIGDFRYNAFGTGAGCPANCPAGFVAAANADIGTSIDTSVPLGYVAAGVAPSTADNVYADKDFSNSISGPTNGDFRYTKVGSGGGCPNNCAANTVVNCPPAPATPDADCKAAFTQSNFDASKWTVEWSTSPLITATVTCVITGKAAAAGATTGCIKGNAVNGISGVGNPNPGYAPRVTDSCAGALTPNSPNDDTFFVCVTPQVDANNKPVPNTDARPFVTFTGGSIVGRTSLAPLGTFTRLRATDGAQPVLVEIDGNAASSQASLIFSEPVQHNGGGALNSNTDLIYSNGNTGPDSAHGFPTCVEGSSNIDAVRAYASPAATIPITLHGALSVDDMGGVMPADCHGFPRLYADNDASGTVSTGDFRFTTFGAYGPNAVPATPNVAFGDSDVGGPVATTVALLRHATGGSPAATDTIYADIDGNGAVGIGDFRFTDFGASLGNCPAGCTANTFVRTGDGDIATSLSGAVQVLRVGDAPVAVSNACLACPGTDGIRPQSTIVGATDLRGVYIPALVVPFKDIAPPTLANAYFVDGTAAYSANGPFSGDGIIDAVEVHLGEPVSDSGIVDDAAHRADWTVKVGTRTLPVMHIVTGQDPTNFPLATAPCMTSYVGGTGKVLQLLPAGQAASTTSYGQNDDAIFLCLNPDAVVNSGGTKDLGTGKTTSWPGDMTVQYSSVSGFRIFDRSNNDPTCATTTLKHCLSDMAAGVIVGDKARPVVLNTQPALLGGTDIRAETADRNLDGKLDAMKITFSEAVKDSTFRCADWSISGHPLSGNCIDTLGTGATAPVGSPAINDNVIWVTFAPGSSFDTGTGPNTGTSLPDLSVIDGGNMTDLFGNGLRGVVPGQCSASTTPGVVKGCSDERDGAPPVVVSVQAAVGSDIVALEFSEPVIGSGTGGVVQCADVYYINTNGAGASSCKSVAHSTGSTTANIQIDVPLTADDFAKDSIGFVPNAIAEWKGGGPFPGYVVSPGLPLANGQVPINGQLVFVRPEADNTLALDASATTATTLTLKWTGPNGGNGGAYLLYQCECAITTSVPTGPTTVIYCSTLVPGVTCATTNVPAPADGGTFSYIAGKSPALPLQTNHHYNFTLVTKSALGTFSTIGKVVAGTPVALDNLAPADFTLACTSCTGTSNVGGTVTFTWSTPADLGGGVLAGYTVGASQSGISSAAACAAAVVSKSLSPTTPGITGSLQSLTVSGLTNGQWTICVVASDNAATPNTKMSQTTITVTGVAGADTTAPGAVLGLTATLTNSNDSVVLLSWTPPGNDGTTGGPVNGYVIQFDKRTGATCPATPTATATTASSAQAQYSPATLLGPGTSSMQTATLTGLDGGSTYCIWVTAIDTVQSGTPGSVSILTGGLTPDQLLQINKDANSSHGSPGFEMPMLVLALLGAAALLMVIRRRRE